MCTRTLNVVCATVIVSPACFFPPLPPLWAYLVECGKQKFTYSQWSVCCNFKKVAGRMPLSMCDRWLQTLPLLAAWQEGANGHKKPQRPLQTREVATLGFRFKQKWWRVQARLSIAGFCGERALQRTTFFRTHLPKGMWPAFSWGTFGAEETMQIATGNVKLLECGCVYAIEVGLQGGCGFLVLHCALLLCCCGVPWRRPLCVETLHVLLD